MPRFEHEIPRKDHGIVVKNVVHGARFSSPIPPYTGIPVVYPRE